MSMRCCRPGWPGRRWCCMLGLGGGTGTTWRCRSFLSDCGIVISRLEGVASISTSPKVLHRSLAHRWFSCLAVVHSAFDSPNATPTLHRFNSSFLIFYNYPEKDLCSYLFISSTGEVRSALAKHGLGSLPATDTSLLLSPLT